MQSLKEWIRNQVGGLALLMFILLVVFPLTLDLFRLNLLGKYLSFAFVSLSLVMLWGYGGVLSLGQGVFFGLGGYCMAMFLKLEAASAFVDKDAVNPWHSGLHGLESAHCATCLVDSIQVFSVRGFGCRASAVIDCIHHRLRDVQTPCWWRVFRDHHTSGGTDSDGFDHWAARLYRRLERHHRFEDDAGMGYSN